MKIETLHLSDIREYDRNARTHSAAQVRQIAASIREFGFNDPVAVDENNVLIEGHGRLAAARLLNLVEIPAIRLAHLTPAQRDARLPSVVSTVRTARAISPVRIRDARPVFLRRGHEIGAAVHPPTSTRPAISSSSQSLTRQAGGGRGRRSGQSAAASPASAAHAPRVASVSARRPSHAA